MKIIGPLKTMGSANIIFGFILIYLLGHAWQARLNDTFLCTVLLFGAGCTALAFVWVARGRVRLIEAARLNIDRSP